MTPGPDPSPRPTRASPPVALTVAGSDSGGGAGIQADLKTFAALGVHGASAVTAITAQNTVAVTGVEEVPPALVAGQIAAVVSDFEVGAAKTGMLSSAAIVERVFDALDGVGFPVVVDPVMVAKSGDRLLRPDAVEAVRKIALPAAALVTPNVPEAEDLTGLPVRDEAEMREAAARLVGMGAGAALVKGGHLGGDGEDIADVLFDGDSFSTFRDPRIRTRADHGTGCTLSAAVAARLALGAPLPEAVAGAREYLREAMRRSLPLGAGRGPMAHLPLAGGRGTGRPEPARFRITAKPLDPDETARGLEASADGAVVVFSGVVRDRNRGRRVLHLEYEAYVEMATPVLERVAEDVRGRFGVERLRIHHRIGRVEIGEASVVVVAAAPHRGAAFRAAEHAMAEIKRIVPVWKHEFFEGGDVWVEGPKEPVTR